MAATLAATFLSAHPMGNSSAATDAPFIKPVLAWAAGPFEARVSFDRALDPEITRTIIGAKIGFEEKTTETLAPEDRRGTLQVTAARLDDAGKTLVLVTDPHPRAGVYSLRLPGVKEAGAPSGRDTVVAYTLEGFETAWESDDPQSSESSNGWLARLDSAEAPKVPGKPGKWTVSTMLTLPPGTVTVRLRSNRPFEASLGGEEPVERLEPKDGAVGFTRFQVESNGAPTYFSAVFPTCPDYPALSLELAIGEWEKTDLLKPVPSSQTMLPWVPTGRAESVVETAPPNLEGGDPLLGKAVFQGATGKCSTCHKAGGEGGAVGPDLSGLVGRDPLSVYRDIADPSARIHPDYVSYTIAKKDGTVAVGTVRSLGADAIVVTNSEAKATTIRRDEIEEVRPSATSIMPVGLVGALGEKNLRDLIAYLVNRPPR